MTYNQSTGILTGTIQVKNGNNTAIASDVTITATIILSPGGFYNTQ